MAKQIVEIPVADLKIGVYVSRLDRPWIESPFLFQGFEIETDEELAQLRNLCSTVHVEVTAAEMEAILAARAKLTIGLRPASGARQHHAAIAPDELTIDKSFVMRMATLQALAAMGCDYAQGFLYSPAISGANLKAWLHATP